MNQRTMEPTAVQAAEEIGVRDIASRLDGLCMPEPNTGCTLFTGMLDKDGYGRLDIKRGGAWRKERAHRVAYEVATGPILDGLTLDHLCRNRACINPAHMEAVTRGENVLRGEGHTAINARKTECLRGHPLDDANTYVYRGKRECRTCRREVYAKRKYGQEAPSAAAPAARGHQRGRALDPTPESTPPLVAFPNPKTAGPAPTSTVNDSNLRGASVKKLPFQARQGDVWIESVESIPTSATEVANEGRVVLAYGEVTGHAHAITIDPAAPHVREYSTAESAERFLRITKAASLVHEEHGTIVLPPGEYRSFIQREYSPDAIRQVVD